MTSEELKIRQLTNQHILSPADKLTVVRDLCGLQAQFMANAMHSLQLRTNDFDPQTLADGLVKSWSVRGTVHVFAESDLHYLFVVIMGLPIAKMIGGAIPFGISGENGP